ncbi:leucine-rich repeat-containing protein [Tanacetum coccineum]
MLSKKQKVVGALADQSIEQLNDVTAVTGVNLRCLTTVAKCGVKTVRADEPEGSSDGDDGRGKSSKVNKEEDYKMRTTAANVASFLILRRLMLPPLLCKHELAALFQKHVYPPSSLTFCTAKWIPQAMVLLDDLEGIYIPLVSVLAICSGTCLRSDDCQSPFESTGKSYSSKKDQLEYKRNYQYSCSFLEFLDLSKNKFFGDSLPVLGKSSYFELDLSDNDFSGKIPTNLPEGTRALYLGGNKFSGILPWNLTKLVKLRLLDLGEDMRNKGKGDCVFLG